MAPMEFEPMTSCLLDRRSNQLSYGALLEGTRQYTKAMIMCYT